MYHLCTLPSSFSCLSFLFASPLSHTFFSFLSFLSFHFFFLRSFFLALRHLIVDGVAFFCANVSVNLIILTIVICSAVLLPSPPSPHPLSPPLLSLSPPSPPYTGSKDRVGFDSSLSFLRFPLLVEEKLLLCSQFFLDCGH